MKPMPNIRPAPELRDRKTRFVEIFRTTPARTVCPNFYVLSHANGCAFTPHCSYCYLKSSFWYLREQRVYVNAEAMVAEAASWIRRDGLESYVLNMGNLSDSLVFEDVRPVMGRLVDLFRREAEEKGRPHTLLVVTKGGPAECTNLFTERPSRNVVVSFSINEPEAARIHESGTPSTAERLRAARLLRDRGWRVRIRIDPMIAGFDYRAVASAVRDLGP
jgi:DNA repair photolyase